MASRFTRGLAGAGLLTVLVGILPPGVQAQQRTGVEIWEANCGRCHVMQPVNKYDAKAWRSVGMHMAITARLTSAQRDAVIAFLIAGSRTAAAQPASETLISSASLTNARGHSLTVESKAGAARMDGDRSRKR
jgi:hypothetical protein